MTDEIDDTPPMADYMASVRRHALRTGLRLKQEFMRLCPSNHGQRMHPDEIAFLADDTDELAEEDTNMVLAFTPPAQLQKMAAEYEAAQARMHAAVLHFNEQGGHA